MILETLLGGGIGGLLRLAPEVLKLLDRKNERKHELAMLDKNNEAERNRAATGLREHELQADSAQITGALAALQEGLRGQFQLTGIKWVDALNQTVRPCLTYGIAAPYVLSKCTLFVAVLWSSGLDVASVQAALAAAYSGADMAILSGILNFYFLGRVFDKRS
jgi:hypothetical protein